jgi:hypothetical protein
MPTVRVPAACVFTLPRLLDMAFDLDAQKWEAVV